MRVTTVAPALRSSWRQNQRASPIIAMTSQSPFRNYARVVQHFASTRALEVLALQASPILGSFLGGFHIERGGVLRLGFLLLGSLALTAHVFVFNDWAGHSSDIL